MINNQEFNIQRNEMIGLKQERSEKVSLMFYLLLLLFIYPLLKAQVKMFKNCEVH